VTIYDDAGAHPLARAPKTKIAHASWRTRAAARGDRLSGERNVPAIKQVS
jgi:hypothetical protein